MGRKKGFKHSKATKKKISEANKKRKLTKETRKKISEALKGHKVDGVIVWKTIFKIKLGKYMFLLKIRRVLDTDDNTWKSA
jgi:hypothetical protein